MDALLLSLLFGAPWIAATVWAWSHAPRLEVAPRSVGERALQRLKPDAA